LIFQSKTWAYSILLLCYAHAGYAAIYVCYVKHSTFTKGWLLACNKIRACLLAYCSQLHIHIVRLWGPSYWLWISEMSNLAFLACQSATNPQWSW